MGVSEADECSLSLDTKLLRFMEQLELLEEKRAALNSLTEQGWFSIAKARYSLGNKQVSALQFAAEMEPLVSVHASKLDNGEVEFRTERVTPSQDGRKELMSVEEIGAKEEGVRRRNKPVKVVTDGAENKDPEPAPVRRKDLNPGQDPLRWFGVLVPQPLKQAQTSFKQVIELSAEIATLQAAVLSCRRQLRDGMKSKRELLQKENTAAEEKDQVEDEKDQVEDQVEDEKDQVEDQVEDEKDQVEDQVEDEKDQVEDEKDQVEDEKDQVEDEVEAEH